MTGIGSGIADDMITANEFGGIVSAVKVSPNVANRVYFGVDANGGKIIRVDNAHSSSPVFTELGATVNGYVSSIDIEVGNEDHILTTFSNFNLTSVWESTNGGTSFTSVEGDLPNMPVRWGIFDPNTANQAILATELGVWSTTLLNGSSTDWNPTNSGLANTRVDMIEYRESDNLMVAGTHGRGVFTSTSFNIGCNISIISLGAQNCDAVANTYTQEISLELINTPSSGEISIAGQLFTIPFNEASTTLTVTLVDLVPDSNPVDVSMFFTADNSCQKDFVALFDAPNPGCSLDNNICDGAFLITETGTFTSNGPADGEGCHNCSDGALHADWYKFTAPTTGTVSIASCGYGVDTRFWFYSGDCNNLVAVANNDDACILGQGSNSPWASEVLDIPVTAGVTYFLEWDDRWDDVPMTFDFTYTGSGDPCDGLTHRFVDEGSGAGGDGCTWATAYDNLQDAIDAIESENTVNSLWIKEGTYKPGATGEGVDRNTSFTIAETTNLYGGFDGTETNINQRDATANITILSGDIGVTAITSDNSYHVIEHTSSTAILTLDGLNISDGNSNSGDNSGGGGILNSGELVLIDCIISNNASTTPGSGICNSGSSAEMTAIDSKVINNAGIQYCIENGAELIVPSNTTLDIEN